MRAGSDLSRACGAGEPMARWQSHEERLLEQIDSLCPRELAAFCRGVLVAEDDVELAAENMGFEGARGHLAEQDSEVWVGTSEPGDRGRREPGKSSRERAEPDVVSKLPGQSCDLRVGQLEAPRD